MVQNVLACARRRPEPESVRPMTHPTHRLYGSKRCEIPVCDLRPREERPSNLHRHCACFTHDWRVAHYYWCFMLGLRHIGTPGHRPHKSLFVNSCK